MARTIYTTINNDNIHGSRIVNMDFCPCKVFVIKRDDDDFIRENAKGFSKPALYVLLNKDSRKAYIGETDNFQQRLLQHKARKPFWSEAYAFTANDGSLTQTEVQYLESVAYRKASASNNYDLSENGQNPQEPYIQDIQKYKADEFFKYVCMLSDFIGCDVFSSGKRSAATSSKGSIRKVLGKTEPDESLAGRVTITLNGKGPYKKNRFVHAVVKEYINKYPAVSFTELREIFPNELLAGWARWELLEDNISEARMWKERGDVKARHLLDDNDILKTADGHKFVVCTEWDKNNLPNIIAIVKSEGWSYSVIK